MEGGAEGLRTVECLRGRLLAERAASRAAKEDADLMDSKLKELEKQLRIETRAKKRFEKKLTFLKNKLQYLNIPFVSSFSSEEYSDNSVSSSLSSSSTTSSRASVSGNSKFSCISSTGSNAAKLDPQDKQPKTLKLISNSTALTNSVMVPDQTENNARSPVLQLCCPDHENDVLSSEKNCSTNGHGCGRSRLISLDSEEQYPSSKTPELCQEAADTEAGFTPTTAKSSTSSIGADEETEPKSQMGEEEDNNSNSVDGNYSMALVLFEPPPSRGESDSRQVKEAVMNTNEKVGELLDTLKHIRETIHTTILERRQMMIPV